MMLNRSVKIQLLLLLCLISTGVQSQHVSDSMSQKVSDYLSVTMKDAKIPGLSYVIVSDGEVKTGNLGYSNIGNQSAVNSNTLFELGSTSKAFTALTILKLQKENKINLNDEVSKYVPWFRPSYKGMETAISIKHLLHHTSGIPFYSISLLPEGNMENALEKTVRKINDIGLNRLPGKKYEYATVNYDILAYIVEQVTNQSFESYIKENIFEELGLSNTDIGMASDSSLMSTGYKIGFFKPREYKAPTYKGNNAAGYIITNGKDIARWLQLQMGLIPSNYDSLIEKSHDIDEVVITKRLSTYTYGWYVSLKGDGKIYHGGLNPNFSSYITFQKNEGIGVAILANSNSPYTRIIGQNIMKILAGEEVQPSSKIEDSRDKAFSVLSIILCIYLLFVLSFLGYIIFRIVRKKRTYIPFDLKRIAYVFSILLLLVPVLYGIYLIPKAMAGFTWNSALVWSPISFPFAVLLSLASIGLSYIAFLISVIFPEKNKYIRDAPKIILLSILSGLSNLVVILLITSSIKNAVELKYVMYYFGLTMVLYLLCRKIVQTRMIFLTRSIIYDLRMKLVKKVFSTSYEKFEKIDRGRIFTTMNDDIGRIGESANTFVSITTSIITAGAAFLYMATLTFWAALVTVLLIGTLSTIYYFVSRRTKVLFEDARETRTVYLRLLNGIIDGFKELSIHRNKKNEYKKDVEYTTDEYRRKMCTAHIKFLNASLVGDSLLIIVLATVSFAIPMILSDIQSHTVMSFVIILLYLIGPINAILRSVPQLMQLKISWNRVQSFMNDIPANLNLGEVVKPAIFDQKNVNSIKAQSVMYKYSSPGDNKSFSVGPINLEVNKGEALFIVGGNGSGKTTLAKLLTGLYPPQKGSMLINDKKMASNEIGEYFSTVFNPFHLFHKLYDTDLNNKSEELTKYLTSLQLDKKVSVRDNQYSTINLSGGQRKRLALLQCYLEDKPIFLFDEWAADQDPEFKKYFYYTILPILKEKGKIIIAITHDDNYFHMADKIVKMDFGNMKTIKKKICQVEA